MTALDRVSQLRRLGPVFRAQEAIAAGLSWRDLYQLRDDGVVVTLSRGVYQLADLAGGGEIDFVAVCQRAPHGMICLNSALAYWDFSDENPAQVHLAVRKGATRPRIVHPPTVVHVFEPSTFELGRVRVDGDGHPGFWITDRERSLVDAHRMRHRIGSDVAAHALRRYLAQPRRDLARLGELAHALGVERALRDDLQVLLS